MNKKILVNSSIIVIVLLLLIGGIIIAQDIRMISVESVYLKEKPQNFSKTLTTLQLHDKIEVLEELDTWLMVVTTDEEQMEGYIQTSAVSTEGIGSDTSDDISQGDAATAGARGFNEDIENEYKKDATYDYDAVDKAEKITDAYAKDPESLFRSFRKEGNLGEFQLEGE